MRRIPATRAIVIAGLRPLVDVAESKITAHLPGDIIEPMIWLREYKQKWNRTFVYRQPLRLPAGTRIVADPPVAIELITKQSP
jgi:hypothetical protein